MQARTTQAYPKLGKGTARKLTGSGYWHGHHAGQCADLDGTRITGDRRTYRLEASKHRLD